MKITINLAGTFFGKFLNEGLEPSISERSTLENLLEFLNTHYNTTVFSKKNLKNNMFVMICNGTRVEPEELKNPIEDGDQISILQPIMGG